MTTKTKVITVKGSIVRGKKQNRDIELTIDEMARQGWTLVSHQQLGGLPATLVFQRDK